MIEAQRLRYVVQRTNVWEVLELLQVRKEIYCKVVEEVIKPSHEYISHIGKETECIFKNFWCLILIRINPLRIALINKDVSLITED